MRPPILICCAALAGLLAPSAAGAGSFAYTVAADVPLRAAPSAERAASRVLDHNQSLILVAKQNDWCEVETRSGAQGYVPCAALSKIWIKVHKKERRLFLMRGNQVVAGWRVALSPDNPNHDKVKQGDGATPEGRFYIAEADADPPHARYGARSLRLSYPNIEDARRGLRDKLINRRAYVGILRDIRARQVPNQRTKLGSSIRIHGGGSSSDWTRGCVGMADEDVIALFDQVQVGTRVDIYRSADQDREFNAPDYLNRLILVGAKQQLEHPAHYTRRAMGITPLSYPWGDIPKEHAVCTDIIIRALRHAGIDLQALIHEDILIHPQRYRRSVRRPNANIDHRRVRNIQIYFEHHARVVPKEAGLIDQTHYLPGDIVLLDTGIANGTVYDHIGVVSDSEKDRTPQVVNIWTTGYRTAAMDLLGREYPTLVGHIRLTHPFDY